MRANPNPNPNSNPNPNQARAWGRCSRRWAAPSQSPSPSARVRAPNPPHSPASPAGWPDWGRLPRRETTGARAPYAAARTPCVRTVWGLDGAFDPCTMMRIASIFSIRWRALYRIAEL
eukprot:scaffold129392_cov60-Phaeocystis_antarctica.AAC.2